MAPKIAIIGSGISGLTAAYLLNEKFDIHLFEANDYIGGHTCTIDINENGKILPLDVGFIVFNYKTYPQFTQLLKNENIKVQTSEMSFSYESFDKSICYNGHTLSTLLADPRARSSLKFYSFIFEIFRFNRLAKKALKTQQMDNQTVNDFLKHYQFSDFFIQSYIQPLAASVWSSAPSQILAFPLKFFISFLANHGLFNLVFRPKWYVIQDGSKRYIQAITKKFINRIHLNTPIRTIIRDKKGVSLHTDLDTINFDKVIIATHSDEALHLLQKPFEDEINVLKGLPYQRNEVILHTDASIMPSIKRCWASWNFTGNLDNQCSVTYYLNKLQSIKSNVDYFVSVNLSSKIDSSKIMKKFIFHHPVFSEEAIKAQLKINDINGKHNTYFCGAYWGYGFHEDGMASAIKTCNTLQEHYAQ